MQFVVICHSTPFKHRLRKVFGSGHIPVQAFLATTFNLWVIRSLAGTRMCFITNRLDINVNICRANKVYWFSNFYLHVFKVLIYRKNFMNYIFFPSIFLWNTGNWLTIRIFARHLGSNIKTTLIFSPLEIWNWFLNFLNSWVLKYTPTFIVNFVFASDMLMTSLNPYQHFL